LRDMVETYRLPRNPESSNASKPAYGGIFVTPDYEIPLLRNGSGRAYAAGQITKGGPQPAVDSFLGLQYAALRSVDHLGALGAPSVSLFGPLRSFSQWLKWCTSATP